MLADEVCLLEVAGREVTSGLWGISAGCIWGVRWAVQNAEVGRPAVGGQSVIITVLFTA